MRIESPQHVAARRVVIDTNVWISAALSKTGAPARLVRHVLDHGLPVFSSATFAELEARLWRPKFDRYLSMELRQRILHDLNAAAYWVEIPSGVASQTYCRDADDDKFIHSTNRTSALVGDGRPGFITNAFRVGFTYSCSRRSVATT